MKRSLIYHVLTGLFATSLVMGTLAISVQATFIPPAGETPSGFPLYQLEEVIDEYVSGYIGETTPGAAIAVVKDGHIIFSKGYGTADLEQGIPVDPETTVFEWASISKLFTWTSVMQQMEEGRIHLDTDIKTYLLEEFAATLPYTQPITLRDIMNHAAGFGDYAFNAIVFSPEQLVSLEEAILRDQPKQYYEVGTASAYSNYATSLAGYVVQTISGQSIEDYQRERIFHPLSMKHTSAHPLLEDHRILVEHKAQGYLSDHQGGFQPGKWSYVSHRPAGSINGTVEDLARFAIALTPGPGEVSPLFANPETLETMLAPSYDPDGKMVGTAHGFFQYRGESPAFGHGGNTAAFSGQFAVVPEDRFGVVILTNAYLEMNMLFGLQDLLLGNNRTDIRVPGDQLPSAQQVAGRYVPVERQEGNFVDFAKYISLYHVKALDENTITMNIGPFEGTYLQTMPHTYELIDDNHPLFRNVYPELRFQMEEAAVQQIQIGNGMDLSPLPPGRTMPFLMGSLAVLLVNVLFFTIAPMVLLVMYIRQRKQNTLPVNQQFYRYYSILVLLGTVTLINNLIPPAKIMSSSFHTFAVMKPHLLLNVPLLLGAIIMTLLTARSMKKANISVKQKGAVAITVTCLTLLFTLLFHWHFFAIAV